jgi:predicted acetyltransferase
VVVRLGGWRCADLPWPGSIGYRPVTATLGQSGSQLWVTVRPMLRRQGLGRELLTAALPLARTNGITRAVIEIARTNEAARRLIEAAGAQPVEHRPAEQEERRRYLLSTE